MMNLRRILGAAKNNNNLKFFLQKYTTECHLNNDDGKPSINLSTKIIYSSHLENQNIGNPYKRRRFWEHKHKKNKNSNLVSGQTNQRIEYGQSGGIMTPQHSVGLEFPKKWMDDYEFYEGGIDEDGNINSMHGTCNPRIPPSTVPCNGCGAHLHCANPSLPGYIPTEIFDGRTKTELKTIICQRCHFLKHYNIALDVEVSADSYIQTISKIQNEFALAIVIIDLLDFPCSIWPDMQRILGPKRPVFVVGNKVDLLPRDSSGYLDHIKECLKQEIIKKGFDSLNIKNVSLISAKTGYGIEELITQLHKIWKYKGDVYLLGCTNVGKSTLFNILLNSDYCRPEATDLVQKATTCPWPGTTLQMLKFPILRPSDIRIYQRSRRLFSESAQRAAEEKLQRDQVRKTGKRQSAKLIGTVGRTFDTYAESMDPFAMSRGTNPIVTLDERKIEFQKGRWCYDTPGVMHPEQITNLLTTEELLHLAPEAMIPPRCLRFKPGMSVFLAGLARLDFLEYSGSAETDWIKIFIFAGHQQPLTMTLTEDADGFYSSNLGTDLLGPPCGPAERLANWPGLQSKYELLEVEGQGDDIVCCDIMLSSVGWVGLCIPKDNRCTLRAWTPYGRGIYMRTPALIPHANRLIGKKIRNSMAYNTAKPYTFQK